MQPAQYAAVPARGSLMLPDMSLARQNAAYGSPYTLTKSGDPFGIAS